MKRKYIFFILILFSRCVNKDASITKVVNKDTLITGVYVNGRWEGEVCYSIKDRLVARFNYKNGLKTGVGVNYYPNNVMKDSAYYLNDKKNGNYFIFDTSGKLKYKYYFLAGSQFGPMFEYDNGILKRYGFLSFEKVQILNSRYDSVGNWIESEGHFIFAKSYILSGENYMGLFLYFPSPPGLNFNYSFGLFNDSTKEIKKISDLNSDRVFLDTVLHKPNAGWFYYVSVDYLDSVANKVHQKIEVLNEIN